MNKISVNPDFYFEYDLRILTKNCYLEPSASVVKDKQKLSDCSLWEIKIYDYREVIQKCQRQFFYTNSM
jgi:hypothetical protein